MVHSARATGYIVSGLPTYSRATTGRRPLTPRTTTQVRLFKQLLDKRTGALLVLPQIRGRVSRVGHGIPRVSSDGIIALTPVFLQRLRCGTSHGGSFAPHRQRLTFRLHAQPGDSETRRRYSTPSRQLESPCSLSNAQFFFSRLLRPR